MTRETPAHPAVLDLLDPREQREIPVHKETREPSVLLDLLVSVA